MISNVSQALAETVGRAWAASARAGWERHGTMFEKYDSGREGERLTVERCQIDLWKR